MWPYITLTCLFVYFVKSLSMLYPWSVFFSGQEPAVVARGGFSGLFPESSASANALAISTSSPGLTMLCNLQMTSDGVGLCLPDIRLDNSTTISTLFPKGQKTYKVNGQDLKGWFALDYSADTIFSNVSCMSLLLIFKCFPTPPPVFWCCCIVEQWSKTSCLGLASSMARCQSLPWRTS